MHGGLNYVMGGVIAQNNCVGVWTKIFLNRSLSGIAHCINSIVNLYTSNNFRSGGMQSSNPYNVLFCFGGQSCFSNCFKIWLISSLFLSAAIISGLTFLSHYGRRERA